MPPRLSRPYAAALLICAMAATASACSSSGSSTASASSAATHSATANTSPSPASPAAAALAAYRVMWADVAEAGTTDDYQASYLGDHLAGQALLTITDNLTADKQQGIVGRGAPILDPVVTSASSSTVAISDCLDDVKWLQYNVSTNKPLNTTPGGLRATTATVTDEDGTWKVTKLDTGAEGTCHLSSPTG